MLSIAVLVTRGSTSGADVGSNAFDLAARAAVADLTRPRPRPRRASSALNVLLSFVCVLLVTASDAGWALDRDLSIRQFNQTRFGVRDGAPLDVWAMAQTVDGWLWFGGTEGLVRFDGVRFEHVDLPPSDTHLLQVVSTLLALPSGELLVGYGNGGVSVLGAGKSTHYQRVDGLDPSPVLCLARGADGALWSATSTGLWRLDGRRWQIIGADWNFPDGYASSVILDQRGTLWVAAKGEILSLEKGARRFARHGLAVANQAELIQSPDGRTWYSDDGAVRVLPEQAGVAARSPLESSSTSYITMFDRDGGLWSLPEGTVARIAYPEHVQVLTKQAYTASEALTKLNPKTLLEDRDGAIWVGTVGGLQRLRNVSMVSVLPVGPAGLAEASDGAILMALYGTPWESKQTDGVWKFEGGAVQRLQGGEIGSASALHRSRDGTIWLAGPQGLWRYDGKRFAKVAALPVEASGESIKGLVLDSNGDPWISITGAGLFRFHDSVWQRNGDVTGLPSRAPAGLASDDEGRVWLGYYINRVAIIQSGRAILFGPDAGLKIGLVTAFSTGRYVLAAGSDGVAMFRNGRFESITPDRATAFDGVTGIVELGNGDVWLNCAQGAVRIVGESLTAMLQKPGLAATTETFGSDDGYPGFGGLATSTHNPRMALTAEGRIWLTGSDGVAWLDPARIKRDFFPPTAVIRSLTVDGRIQAAPVTLAAGTRGLQIDYTALNAARPERLIFRYRLDGVDDTWIDAGTRRQAFYTNLGPGHYRFQVLAKNESGVWSASPAALGFDVPPTFVQTHTFIALCFAAALGALVLFYRIRIRQLTVREQQLAENRLQERERIARELHDTLLQSTQGLILSVQAAAERVPRGETVRDMLEHSLGRATSVMTEGRDRIQALRTRADAAGDLVRLLSAAGAELASDHAGTLGITVEGTERQLMPGVLDEAFSIGREAIFNACRHASAASIEVQIIYGKNDFRVRVRDDGRGIEPATFDAGFSPNHWGLIGMQERGKRIGGTLTIWSSPGAGTEIELVLPEAVAYRVQAKRPRWLPSGLLRQDHP